MVVYFNQILMIKMTNNNSFKSSNRSNHLEQKKIKLKISTKIRISLINFKKSNNRFKICKILITSYIRLNLKTTF